MGGAKLFQMRTSSVQNHFSYNNQAQGLWFDTDNQNITIDGGTLVGNVMAGLQIERDEGPLTVQNSHFCSSGQGINVLTSPNLVIKNNTFYNNSGTNKYQAQIFIAGQAGGRIITDYLSRTELRPVHHRHDAHREHLPERICGTAGVRHIHQGAPIGPGSPAV